MIDVLVAGAGPAGAVAASVLARQGARVLMVDRAVFPRDKLCGDTVNPGALAVLRRLRMAGAVEREGLRVDGMRITGPDGVSVEGRYGDGLYGLALSRRGLDAALLERAIAAGAELEEGTAVSGVLLRHRGRGREGGIEGLTLSRGGRSRTVTARVTIAADGRRSTIAFALGLAHHPEHPRRWAIGAYFEGATGAGALGEMHVRAGHYVGVAPLPGGVTNACLVYTPGRVAPGTAGSLETCLRRAIEQDPVLRDRFARARIIGSPRSLGPLAVDVRHPGMPGLLLAGDAAGFIDPMTGDGLRFAIRGGELAAHAASLVLDADPAAGRAHDALAWARAREFRGKWRFNRVLRAVVDSAPGVRLGAAGARWAPGVLASLIAVAGDTRCARSVL